MQITLNVTLTRESGVAVDDLEDVGAELVEAIESYNTHGKVYVQTGADPDETTTYDISATYEIADETDDDPEAETNATRTARDGLSTG